MKKHHGMLFKAAMVQARQSGLKTMTRRNIEFHNSITVPHVRRDEWHELRWDVAKVFGDLTQDGEAVPFWNAPFRDIVVRVYPRIRPGDIIWVKETWAAPHEYDHLPPRLIETTAAIYYAALHDLSGLKNRPSMLMPRWVSRTDLDVLKVGSQRVQEISYEDCLAEGVDPYAESPPMSVHDVKGIRALFQSLWDSINAAKGFGWEVNHPVWIYEWPAITP